jgi:lipoic acid synthetase
VYILTELVEVENIEAQPRPHRRLPEWLTIRAPKRRPIADVENLIRGERLVTVCEEARCPNLWECWAKKSATFMIMGDTCTRSCRFCAIKTGRGGPLDPDEPRRVAEAAKELGLKHVVVTSVNRDHFPDGGASHFSRTIAELKSALPLSVIEVLTPDFLGKHDALDIVVEAHPHIFNHNIETVPRLYKQVRPQAKYPRSLEVLKYVKESDPTIYTKSGFMVGLGETKDEVVALMKDLREWKVDAITIGQYLRPGKGYLDVVEYIHPDQFAEYKKIGLELGFIFVASGPFVRSSHNAIELSEAVGLL